MTVQTLTNRIIHEGDGAETIFAYDFYVPDLTYLFVWLDDIQQLTGFTADGEGNATGGNVTFDTAPGVDVVITLMRYLIPDQLIDWRPYDPFQAEVTEDAMDKLTMLCQQITDEAQRAINLPIGDDGTTIIKFPDYVAGETFYWDETERKISTRPTPIPPEAFVDAKRRLFGKISAAGSIVKGSGGYTVSGTGPYTVHFNGNIINAYSLVVSPAEGAAAGQESTVFVQSEDQNGFVVNMLDDQGGGQRNRDWSFILRYTVQESPNLLIGGTFDIPDISPWVYVRGGGPNPGEVVWEVDPNNPGGRIHIVSGGNINGVQYPAATEEGKTYELSADVEVQFVDEATPERGCMGLWFGPVSGEGASVIIYNPPYGNGSGRYSVVHTAGPTDFIGAFTTAYQGGWGWVDNIELREIS